MNVTAARHGATRWFSLWQLPACGWVAVLILAALGYWGAFAVTLALAGLATVAGLAWLARQMARHQARHRSQDARHDAAAQVVAGALADDGKPVPPALERGEGDGAQVLYLTRRAGAHRARRQRRPLALPRSA